MRCPICGGNKAEKLLELDCGNFDNSPLYRVARLLSCKKCGHIFNKLTKREIAGIATYYKKEYSLNNLSSLKYGGDRPGGQHPFSLARYSNLYALFAPFISEETRILDGGCATGGFLKFLRSRGFDKLSGVDLSPKYVAEANKDGFSVRRGDVEKLPFKASSQNLIIVDQVLEHIFDPARVFKEAERVLAPNGFLCISVPDAERYKKNYFFDFYWFIMREHIQHFDLTHLKLLGELNGFEIVSYSKTDSPMMSESMILPALNVLFRVKSGNVNQRVSIKEIYKLRTRMAEYISLSARRLSCRLKVIDKIAKSKTPVCVYGMSREFLFLYKNGLRKANISEFIDDTPFKQKHLRIEGRRIKGIAAISQAVPGAVTLITASAHKGKLRENLNRQGFRGRVISL